MQTLKKEIHINTEYVDMDKEEGKINKNVIQNSNNRNNINNIKILLSLVWRKSQVLLQVLLKWKYISYKTISISEHNINAEKDLENISRWYASTKERNTAAAVVATITVSIMLRI
jgi:hypothetical protein